MPIVTAWPDATGTYAECDYIIGSSALDAVTDSSDSTYIYAAKGVSRKHTFNLPDVSANGTIDSVRFVFRISDGFVMTTGWCKPMFVIGVTSYYGTAQNPDWHSISNHSETWTLSPATSATWTWAEISGMEMGVQIYSAADYWNNIVPCYCYEIYLEVNYTETPVFVDCGGCGPCMI